MKFLFIPGVNNTQSTWTPTRAALEEAGYESLAVNCPPIDDIDALAKSIMPEGTDRYIVVGHSFGGMVALSVLAQMPERVQALVLVNSADGSDIPEVAQSRLEKAEMAMNGGYQALADSASARAYHPNNAGNEDLMAARQQEIERYGAERFAAHQKAIAGRPDRAHTLKSFQGPKLIISADQDLVIPTNMQKQMAEQAGAEYCEIPSTGHMMPAEAPEALARQLAAWAKANL